MFIANKSKKSGLVKKNFGSPQINEDKAPQNQVTEGPDEMLGIGSDLKPNKGEPIPPEGLLESKLDLPLFLSLQYFLVLLIINF